MTDRAKLSDTIAARLREQSEMLRHLPAPWQLMAQAAAEIERLKVLLDEARREIDAITR
jgi:hypothetical protein